MCSLTKLIAIFKIRKVMAYSTYTTEAIVCGSRDSNTSDRSYLLFTERAGMLWASARSVRTEKSKQRYALVDFSVIRVSLVRGKSAWRIGCVESLINPFMQSDSRQARAFVQLVVRSLRRFLHGEESAPAVFVDAKAALQLATKEQDFEELGNIYTLRLLEKLGYVNQKPSFAPLLTGDLETLLEESVSAEGLKAIDIAYRASHL